MGMRIAEKSRQALPPSQTRLPRFFRPIFWSYDFSQIDSERDKKTVILNTLNYGDLEHWRWIIGRYGKTEVRKALQKNYITELRPRVRELVSIFFGITRFKHASRGSQ